MKIWTKLATWIGEVGPSPGFVAFNAHCWFAVVAICVTIRNGIQPIPAGLGWFAIFAAKEFWFDLKWEKPKQSLLDSAKDYVGYEAGLVIGIALMGWHII